MTPAERLRQFRIDHPGYDAGRARILRELAQFYKEVIGCPCGEKNHKLLDFHHPDPSTKVRRKTRANRNDPHGPVTFEEFRKLIQTTVVRCVRCHRLES